MTENTVWDRVAITLVAMFIGIGFSGPDTFFFHLQDFLTLFIFGFTIYQDIKSYDSRQYRLSKLH